MITNYLSHKNGQNAYEVSGEGPVVLCTPSLGDVRGEYRFLRQSLVDAGYKTAVMDVRGHGGHQPGLGRLLGGCHRLRYNGAGT